MWNNIVVYLLLGTISMVLFELAAEKAEKHPSVGARIFITLFWPLTITTAIIIIIRNRFSNDEKLDKKEETRLK